MCRTQLARSDSVVPVIAFRTWRCRSEPCWWGSSDWILACVFFNFWSKWLLETTPSDRSPLRTASVKKGEKKRGEEACRAVCGSLQIVWMKKHSCLSCLIVGFFPFGYIFLLPSSHGHSSLFFYYLSIGLLFSSLTSLSVSLKHMFASIASPSPFSLPGLGSVASNAFHSAWLSRHMYPLYIIARTHSRTSVPADLISPSLSSVSLPPLHTLIKKHEIC